MKTGNLLYSAVQFIFATLVFLLGAVFVGLQYAPLLRFKIADFFSSSSVDFSLFGGVIALFGMLLLLGFYWMHRGSYYTVVMGRESVDIDPSIIKGYVSDYLKKTFPDEDLNLEVSISRRQSVELYVQSSSLQFEEHQLFLEKIELDLSDLFSKHLGYFKKFSFTVLLKDSI